MNSEVTLRVQTLHPVHGRKLAESRNTMTIRSGIEIKLFPFDQVVIPTSLSD